jgi:hypothetical protein
MAWTIEDALNDDAIEKVEKCWEGYSFWLKGIPVRITVVLTVNPWGGFNFSVSHAIKTPTQSDAYHRSRPWGDYEGYALHLAVASLTDYYRDAVRAGHVPSKGWLIPNK